MSKRAYAKSLLLPELEKKVNSTEQALGKSSDCGRTLAKTGFTFDGGDPPEGPLKLVQKVAGAAAQLPGASKIYEGTGWSAGVEIEIVAYRMPAE